MGAVMRGTAGLVVALSWALLAAFGASGASAQERAAFYYPWFPETEKWETKYQPTLGKYDSSDQAIMAKHIDMAKYAGLDAFIASWWGQGRPTDTRLPWLLDAAKAKDFAVAPYYEPAGQAATTDAQVKSDFDYLYAKALARGEEWLRVNNRPVLFLYNAVNGDTCSLIQRYLDANAGRFYLDLKVFSGFKTCPNQPDSWHQYGPAVNASSQLPYSYTVSPGFYHCRATSPTDTSHPYLERDLARFKADLAAEKASGADWQLITTFNEWCEGTAVEPATDWSSASGMGDYLDAMRAAFVGAPVSAGRTTDATGVTDTSATLNGDGSCQVSPCSAWFETSNDGFATWVATPHVTVDGAGFKLSQNVAALTAGADYQYRLATSENGGATKHWDASASGAAEGTNYTKFTTLAPPPPPDHAPVADFPYAPASPPSPPPPPPPPADSDGDLVPDLSDRCPGTPAGTAVDANGCPIRPPSPGKHTSVRVYRVVEGDTLKVRMRSGAIRTVRLIGIDTPETVDPGKPTECGGPQASKAMTKLAMRREQGKLVGRAATLVSDPTQDAKDRYGRRLGYIEIAGKDIGRRMIRSGWSTAYVFRAAFRRLGTYTAAENAAKAERRGVWSMCGGDFHRPR